MRFFGKVLALCFSATLLAHLVAGLFYAPILILMAPVSIPIAGATSVVCVLLLHRLFIRKHPRWRDSS